MATLVVDRFVRCSIEQEIALSSEPCFFPHNILISSPCGHEYLIFWHGHFDLIIMWFCANGGRHGYLIFWHGHFNLITMWYCVNGGKRRYLTFWHGHFDLITMWYCVNGGKHGYLTFRHGHFDLITLWYCVNGGKHGYMTLWHGHFDLITMQYCANGGKHGYLTLWHGHFDLITMRYCVNGGKHGISVWFQRSNNCVLPPLIAASGSQLQWTCRMISIAGFFSESSRLQLNVMFFLWGKHDGHGSGFLTGIFIVTFWLAEALGWLTANNLQ